MIDMIDFTSPLAISTLQRHLEENSRADSELNEYFCLAVFYVIYFFYCCLLFHFSFRRFYFLAWKNWRRSWKWLVTKDGRGNILKISEIRLNEILSSAWNMHRFVNELNCMHYTTTLLCEIAVSLNAWNIHRFKCVKYTSV